VTRFDGRTQTLATANARSERVELTWTQRLLSTLAHPQIAYLLLTLGTLGLTIELWSPGAIFPGVAGGICLLLAFFAFQVLPVNYAGVALIVFGILLLVLEIKVTSFGLLGAGGVLSLFLGSVMLVDSPLPALQVGMRLIVPTVVATSAVLIVLVRLAVQAQKLTPVTGESGMVGEIGRALSSIDPGGTGRVQTHGEIWTATALEPISAGDVVRVSRVQGLLLTVRPDKTTAAVPHGQQYHS
jgi:membrane-bound serine protease (ClpP class)